jgi:hypothetical protein
MRIITCSICLELYEVEWINGVLTGNCENDCSWGDE